VHATPRKFGCEIDRGLATEGEHHAGRVRCVVGGLHFVGSRRFEDERVRDIEVRRDGFRIVIDDDGGTARLP
jgi:hypothetical protein